MGTKTLFLGLDGLSCDLMDRMIADGQAPNFAALRATSRSADIRNYPGMGDGPFWSSIACGAPPDRHGRYFHLQYDPRTYSFAPFDETADYRAPPFWRRLAEEGQRVAVIDWLHGPFTPVDKGVLMDNWHGHDAHSGARSWPTQFSRSVMRDYGGDPFEGGTSNRTLETAEDYVDYIDKALMRVEAKTRFAVDQLHANEWDMFALCYLDLHDVGHYAYHLADPSHPKHDLSIRAATGDPLQRCCKALDNALGALLKAAGENASVVIIAGAGMVPLVTVNTAVEEIARRLDLGYDAPASPSETIKHAYKSIIPPKLRWRIAPIARRLRRNFASDLYGERRFFVMPHNDNSAALRINLKGREAYGTVSPGAELDALIEEIRDSFMAIVDADTGVNIVENVVDVRKELRGPAAYLLPDIFIEWNQSLATTVRAVRSPKIGEIVVPPVKRTGDHDNTGFVWARGADAAIFNRAAPVRPHDATAAIMSAARRRQPVSLEAALA